MTCREKLMKEIPDEVEDCYLGGCCGCPCDHDYLGEPPYCDGMGNDDLCTRCWDREIPGTETRGETDNVNHPKHYETGKFECIDVMVETQGVEAVKSFCLCNAFKYIYRTSRKNGLEDIKKAIWYLEKYVELEAEQHDNQ